MTYPCFIFKVRFFGIFQFWLKPVEIKRVVLRTAPANSLNNANLQLNTSNSHLIFLCSALACGSCFIVLNRTFQCLKLFYLDAVPYMDWMNKHKSGWPVNFTRLWMFEAELKRSSPKYSLAWSSLVPRDARTFDGVFEDDFAGSCVTSGRFFKKHKICTGSK